MNTIIVIALYIHVGDVPNTVCDIRNSISSVQTRNNNKRIHTEFQNTHDCGLLLVCVSIKYVNRGFCALLV